MSLTKYKDFRRKGLQIEVEAKLIQQVIESAADAYGYLSGIDPVELGLADESLSNRVALCMDCIVEACAYLGVDIREYVIKGS